MLDGLRNRSPHAEDGVPFRRQPNETGNAGQWRDEVARRFWVLVLPTFAGEPRFQKPPLAYWLALASYELTGRVDEWAARLPSACSALLLTALVGWLGRKFFNAKIGFLAGLIQAASAWTVWFGKMATVDVTLSLLVAVAIVAGAFKPFASATNIISFWAFTGLAILAKGPVALLFILPAVATANLAPLAPSLGRDPAPVRPPSLATGLAMLLGISLFFILALGWPLLVLRRCDGVFDLWYGQSVGRFAEHYGPNTRPWLYYLYEVPAWTLPWTPCWLLGLRLSLQQPIDDRRSPMPRRLDSGRLALLVWFAAPLVLLSLSAGKREHYILPALPPLSIFAAVGLTKILDSIAPRRVALVFAVILTGFWVHEAFLRPRWHGLPAVRAMIERNRALLDQCQEVVQVGSNDRSLIFLVGKPMRWVRQTAGVSQATNDWPHTLMLAPKRNIAEILAAIPCDIVDELGGERSWSEGEPKNDLVLLRPRAWQRRGVDP